MTLETQAQKQAEQLRTKHGLGSAPLGDLVTLTESLFRVDVAVLDVDLNEHGMAMRDPVRDVVVIAVARTKHSMRQRSTLAHELGHLLFGDYASPKTGEWSRRSTTEIRADTFARHFLIPLDGVRAALSDSPKGGTLTEADLSMLVQQFQVSPKMAAIQLRQAGLIGEARKKEWAALTTPPLAARFGWTDHYASLQVESNTRRAPQRLLARATAGYLENVVSLQAIARLRGVSVEVVRAEFIEADITPQVELVNPWATAGDLPVSDGDFSDLDALDRATDHE